MNTGKMRELVTIQRGTVAVDANLHPVKTWTTYATEWAERLQKFGTETVENNAVASFVVTEFRIHYRSDLLPSDRILCDGLNYEITAVLDKTGNRRELYLTCVLYADQ